MGIKLVKCTPMHPQSNGIVEWFNTVLVKIMHTAAAEGRDPRFEVQKRLLNYRSTVHPSTGFSLADLIMGRTIQTKIPDMKRQTNE